MDLLLLEQELSTLHNDTLSPRAIALTRKRLLNKGDLVGLPAKLHGLLSESLRAFETNFASSFSSRDQSFSLEQHPSTRNLRVCLQIHLNCARLDPCLATELGAQGTHVELRRIIQWDAASLLPQQEANQDVLMELQDFTCEIATLYRSFPCKASPFTPEALLDRLPLTFCLASVAEKDDDDDDKTAVDAPPQEVVWIHQVTTRQSAQEDVGFVMWPSAVVLSRWLVSNPSVLSQATRVLEIGAGCGLVGLLAALMMQKQQSTSLSTTRSSSSSSTPKTQQQQQRPQVLLGDFNRTVLDNLQYNIAVNEVDDLCQTVGLDFYQQSGTSHKGWRDMESQELRAPVQVILAADMICQPADAVYAARTIHDALESKGKAYVVCADAAHRFGVDHFARECQKVGLTVTTRNVAELCPRLAQGPDMEKTAGFVDGMNLTMFFIEKPNQ